MIYFNSDPHAYLYIIIICSGRNNNEMKAGDVKGTISVPCITQVAIPLPNRRVHNNRPWENILLYRLIFESSISLLLKMQRNNKETAVTNFFNTVTTLKWIFVLVMFKQQPVDARLINRPISVITIYWLDFTRINYAPATSVLQYEPRHNKNTNYFQALTICLQAAGLVQIRGGKRV